MGAGVLATFGSAADEVESAIGLEQPTEVLGREFGGAIQIRVEVGAGDVGWESGDCHTRSSEAPASTESVTTIEAPMAYAPATPAEPAPSMETCCHLLHGVGSRSSIPA